MKDDSVKSKTIEWLRFFCAAAVVVLHSAGKPLEGNVVISCQYGAYDAIRILFSHGLCRVAVPLFFFISGYIFFVGLHTLDGWNAKCGTRSASSEVIILDKSTISATTALAVANSPAPAP